MKNILKNYWALLIPLIVLAIALYFIFGKSNAPEDNPLGMIEGSFTDIAAEFPGRLDSLYVQEGDTVKKGQLLGVLKTTEINLVKNQALAAIDVAKNNALALEKGTRPEIIRSAENILKITQDQYDLVKRTYDRMEKLYESQAISGQEKDLVYFRLQAAKKEMETAQVNLEMLQKGTRPELIKAAQSVVNQAEQAYNLSKALGDNARVYAPEDGIISSLVINQGEIVNIGYPMMTMLKDNSYVARFNIRQDKARGLERGVKVQLKVPGCSPDTFEATVSSISPSLDFANWVPSHEKGQFELRTYTIECKAVQPSAIKGLRPGMTASLIRL